MNNDVYTRVRADVVGELQERLRARSGANGHHPGDERAVTDEVIQEALDRLTTERITSGRTAPEPGEEAALRRAIAASLYGLGGLQRYIDDPDIDHIDVNGCDDVFVVYADDPTPRRVPPLARSNEELIDLIQRAAVHLSQSDRRFDRSSPFLLLDLPDGSRLHAVMGVTRVPSLSIRRFRFRRITLDDLVAQGTLDGWLRDVLDACVRSRLSMIVSGGPYAGKTTLLTTLLSSVPPSERLITVEDPRELHIEDDRERHPNCVSMEARHPNHEGVGAISLSRLVVEALAMRPDRVIVGEVKSAEVIPMLNAMSIGCPGSMATLHSNTAQAVPSRLASCALQAPERLTLEAANLLIATAVNLVVHITRDPRTGQRRVTEVRELTGQLTEEGRRVSTNVIVGTGADGHPVPEDPVQTETLERLALAGLDVRVLDPRRHGWAR